MKLYIKDVNNYYFGLYNTGAKKALIRTSNIGTASSFETLEEASNFIKYYGITGVVGIVLHENKTINPTVFTINTENWE